MEPTTENRDELDRLDRLVTAAEKLLHLHQAVVFALAFIAVLAVLWYIAASA